jgi:hypothetical protein
MKSLILVFALLISVTGMSATDVLRRNIKLPSQEVLHKYEATPATADTDLIIDGAVLGASAQSLSTFLAQPDVARNIVITTGGTTNDVAAGNVVITGKDADGNVISETLALTANQAGATTGNKAFLIVDSISLPVGDSPYGATLDIGTGTKLGLPRCMGGAGYFIKGLVDGVVLTGETVAASASALESNTVIPNPAPNGTRVFTFFFIQNYRCAE